MKNQVFTIPNVITLLRILGTVLLLFFPPMTPVFFAFYTLTGVTDVLDGCVARATGRTSELGARLDSIADLLFYSVALSKLFPSLCQILPDRIWYAVGLALITRLSAYAVAAVKYRRFASLHTWMNKLTGLAVFLVPYILCLPGAVPLCWVVCAIGIVSSGEELMIHLCARHYQAGRRSLFGERTADGRRSRENG